MNDLIHTHRRCATFVNRGDFLCCLDAGMPEDAVAALCGFSAQERVPSFVPRLRKIVPPEPSVTPKPPETRPVQELFLPMATRATMDPAGYENQTKIETENDFFTEDKLRVKHGPPPLEPLMPLSRLWPYLHRVLGHRRPGRRLDAARATRLVAKCLPVAHLPRQALQRWAPQARLILDRSLPPGFLTGDLKFLCQELKALRGDAGMYDPAFDRDPDIASDANADHRRKSPVPLQGIQLPVELVEEAEDIAQLRPHALPTLVLSDLGQLRQDRVLISSWLAFGRKLAALGVTPVALVPCPQDRWDPELAAVWRCACWDRHARLPPPGQGLEAVADPAASEKAARRVERLLTRLAPVSLLEPELLRAIRCTLPPDESDVGAEFDLRAGGGLAVAGHDMALLPATRRAYAERFEKEPETAKRQIMQLIVAHHEGYGPQLRAGEIAALSECGVSLPEALQNEAADIQDRTNNTMLRDLDAPDMAQRLGLFAHSRWESDRWSRKMLRTEQAATIWAFLCRHDRIENPEIPDGMNPEHFSKAMKRVLPNPGYVTQWTLDMIRGCDCPSALAFRVRTRGANLEGERTCVPLGLLHVRRQHAQIMIQRGDRLEQRSLTLDPGREFSLPVGAFDRIALRSDCGTLDIETFPPPDQSTCYAWDRFGVYTEYMVGETVFRLRWIPPGTFLMGSPEDEPRRYPDEGPRHRVMIAQGFWLGETPVTQAQYLAVMGNNPSEFQNAGMHAPVEQVSWKESQAFMDRLNTANRTPDTLRFRLPTEAEWEYACRAGTETALYTGPITIKGQNNALELDAIAWYGGNSGVEYEGNFDSSGWPEKQYEHKKAGTHPVKQKAANALGLFDMLGNVWEWCTDHWHENYKDSPVDCSAWVDANAEKGARQVVRGGCWIDNARRCRSACRSWIVQSFRINYVGFRLVLAPSSTNSLEPSKSDLRAGRKGKVGEVDKTRMREKSLFKDMQALWNQACDHMKAVLHPDVFNRWIAIIHPVALQGDTFVLGVDNDFYQTWLEDNYQELIISALRSVGANENLRIRFDVHPAKPLAAAPADTAAAVPAAEQPRSRARLRRPPKGSALNDTLNPKFTFEEFVIGPSNSFAHAAALAVAQAPGRAYNPLFIYGETGLGKTKLMQAIGHRIMQSPGLSVAYVTSETMLNEYVEALQTQTITEFRNKYRGVDALLVDDIQFLAGKEKFQEEFFHTFNALYDARKQMVMTSDRPASEIPGLEKRLVSRFEWGLVTELEKPDFETRLAILRYKQTHAKLHLADEVLYFIAENVKSDMRILEGALLRTLSFALLNSQPLTLDSLRYLLKDLLGKKNQ